MSEILPFLSSNKSACHSFKILAKDMGLLGQNWRALLLLANEAAWASLFFYFLCPMGVTWRWTWSEHSMNVTVEKLEFRKPWSFEGLQVNLSNFESKGDINFSIQSITQIYFWLYGDITSIFQPFMLYRHSQKGILEQSFHCSLFARYTEVQEIYGESSPNIISLRLFLGQAIHFKMIQ